MSYDIQTDLGYEMTRHRRFLRPLHKDDTSDATAIKSADCSGSDDITSADAPSCYVAPLTRQQKAKESSLQPLQGSPAPHVKRTIGLRRSKRNVPSIESIEADLCGQISTNNSLSNFRKPLTDNANEDTIENDNGVFDEDCINKVNVNLIKIAIQSAKDFLIKNPFG